ncbi:MAG: hypothetical protein ACT6U0_08670, partial [Shinella sp.]
MLQTSLGGGFGAQRYGLRASINAAVAYDELCAQYKIDIRYEPQAIIVQGRLPPAVVLRVRMIIFDVAGSI